MLLLLKREDSDCVDELSITVGCTANNKCSKVNIGKNKEKFEESEKMHRNQQIFSSSLVLFKILKLFSISNSLFCKLPNKMENQI